MVQLFDTTADNSAFIHAENADKLCASLKGSHAFITAGTHGKAPLINHLKAESTPPLEGTHLLTIIAESRLLHSREVIEKLCQAIYARGGIDKSNTPTLQLILNEVILNAIEHGNLNLTQVKRKASTNENWMDEYFEDVRKKLNSAAGDSPIIIQIARKGIHLHCQICDAGNGFDYETSLKDIDVSDPYGRGLSLLAAMVDTFEFTQNGANLHFTLRTRMNHDNYQAPSEESAKEFGRILVVDDQEINRDLAIHFLKSAGYRFIEGAEDGIDALAKVEEFKPDIIFLDIMMPNMDGFETCEKLKANPETMNIPVLFLSGMTDIKNRIKGYELGAVDYVTKPFEKQELLARTRVHILNGMALKSLHRFSHRLSDNLEKARHFQYTLLPEKELLAHIADTHNVHFEHEFIPCDELAGDYWSVFPIDKNHIALSLVDFTGHGVLSAMNTIRIHALFHELEEYLHTPKLLITHLNNKLSRLLEDGTFATSVYAVLNTDTGEMQYAGNGAPPFMHVNHKHKTVNMHDCSGFPLGLEASEEPDTTYGNLTINPHDTLMFYSDALIETIHKDGHMWDEYSLKAVLEKCVKKKQDATLFQTVQTQFFRTANTPLRDDLTLISLTYK